MTLKQINEAVLHLAYHGEFSDTNVTGVQNTGTDVIFEIDVSELRAELKEAQEAIDELEKEKFDLKNESARLEKENETLTEIHLKFKDPQSGITPLEYRRQCELAKAEAGVAYRMKNLAEAECVALRRRKGVDSNIMRYQHDVLQLLRYITQANDRTLPTYRDDCAKLLAKLTP